MTRYIDKDALVAEIESLLDKGKYHNEYDCAYRDGNNGVLYALKNKLDTLEVKEMDSTDAFIEKAVEWIDKNAFRYIVTRKYQGLDVTGLDTSLAADFKKALEDML